jgi:hypothetical protein
MRDSLVFTARSGTDGRTGYLVCEQPVYVRLSTLDWNAPVEFACCTSAALTMKNPPPAAVMQPDSRVLVVRLEGREDCVVCSKVTFREGEGLT